MCIILEAYSMAHSISVIMLVDELIANLLNIHNQQFLLSDNELSQSKGLQTLVWCDFIGCFLSSPQNQIPPSFYPWHRHWGAGQGWGKCSGVDGWSKPVGLDTKCKFWAQSSSPMSRVLQAGLKNTFFQILFHCQLFLCKHCTVEVDNGMGTHYFHQWLFLS